MELAPNPERERQIKISELETRIAGIQQLLDKHLVPSGTRSKLEIQLAEYEQELKGYKSEASDQELSTAA